MPVGPRPPDVAVAGFEGPLDLLLELVEEKRLDIFTVPLGELADEYLARVRAMDRLPADEVSAFLYIASRLVLLKARSLLPSLSPTAEEDEVDTEEELRLRLIEYATTKGRAAALGDRMRAGERYSVEQRTVEIEALIAEQPSATFATLLGDRPTLGYAIVTFIALLDLYRRLVIDITQDELFGEIRVERKVRRMEGLSE